MKPASGEHEGKRSPDAGYAGNRSPEKYAALDGFAKVGCPQFRGKLWSDEMKTLLPWSLVTGTGYGALNIAGQITPEKSRCPWAMSM